MELIYVYIDKYRGFAQQGINMSGRFSVAYNDIDNSITVKKNAEYSEIYPKHIKGISAVIGKNATGKTSFLELIGKRIGDRNLCNEISVADKSGKWWEETDDVETNFDAECVNHVASYFLLYYVGIVDDEEIYVFETDDLNKYHNLLSGVQVNNINHRIDNEWFACICTIVNGKLKFKQNNINEKYNEYGVDKSAMLMFNNVSHRPSNVDTKPDRIDAIKRFKVINSGNYLYKQLKFLHHQMNLEMAELYKDEKYTFVIRYPCATWAIEDDSYVINFMRFNLVDMVEWQIATLNIMYNACIDIWSASAGALDDTELCEFTEKNGNVLCDVEHRYDDVKDYYLDLMDMLSNHISDIHNTFSECLKILDSFEEFFKNKEDAGLLIEFQRDGFKITVNKNTKIECCEQLCEGIIDADSYAMRKGSVTLLNGLVSHHIEHLSEGERSNLKLFVSIHHQIIQENKWTKSYILLIDEIEENMHPEMCRRLVSDLIQFLKQYKGKTFQIIFSSHSPFVVSDLQNTDVICFSRNEAGKLQAAQLEGLSFGQNIHTILKKGFFLNNTMGEFARTNILFISELLSSELGCETLISEINTHLCCDMIKAKDELLDYIEKNILTIGEPVLQKVMLKQFENFKVKNCTLDEQIALHEQKIEELKNKKGEVSDSN